MSAAHCRRQPLETRQAAAVQLKLILIKSFPKARFA
jgi:hypothetical protein